MATTRHLDLPTSEGEQDFSMWSVFFVGTATVVLQYAGLTILTDPNFLHAGDHVHLGYGMTSERLTNPAIEIDELPHLDLCILSHMHGDHFDEIAEARLDKNSQALSKDRSHAFAPWRDEDPGPSCDHGR